MIELLNDTGGVAAAFPPERVVLIVENDTGSKVVLDTGHTVYSNLSVKHLSNQVAKALNMIEK